MTDAMSDARLAELEALARGPHQPSYVRELVAEVRRLRGPIDRKALDHMAAERDAAFARVAELEAENDQLKLAREDPYSARLAARILRAEDRADELERENTELRTTEMFCGVCAAGVESSEHHEKCVQPLVEARADHSESVRMALENDRYTVRVIVDLSRDRERARSIAAALEQELARVREMHDRVHMCADLKWYNPHDLAGAKIARPGPCPTIRALDGGAA